MSKFQRIFGEWAVRDRSWMITAAILLIVISAAAMRSLATYKDLHKWDERNQQSCSKTNPDCLEGSSIVVRGPSNTLENETCVGFVRELDAVIDAMNEYNPPSIAKDREYMGVILQCDGRYYYTVTLGQPGRDKVSIRLQRWILRRTTALWHTHGSYARERNYFSDVDTQLANSLGKRFYLGDAMGNLRVFKPGGRVYSDIQARRMGLPSRRGFVAGNLVEDENGQAIEIANEHPIKPPDFGSDDSGFTVMCKLK